MNKSKLYFINGITLLRLVGIPFIFMIHNNTLLFIYAAILFLTDFFDGYLARKWEVTSFNGAILDLIADKVLVLVLFLASAIKGEISYLIFFLIAFREIMSMVLRYINYRYKHKFIKANYIGKLKTTLQFIALAMMILQLSYYQVMIYIMLIVSYISFIMYVKEFLKD